MVLSPATSAGAEGGPAIAATTIAAAGAGAGAATAATPILRRKWLLWAARTLF